MYCHRTIVFPLSLPGTTCNVYSEICLLHEMTPTRLIDLFIILSVPYSDIPHVFDSPIYLLPENLMKGNEKKLPDDEADI